MALEVPLSCPPGRSEGHPVWARLGRMAPPASPPWPRSLLERSRQQASLKWVRMENQGALVGEASAWTIPLL